MSAAGNGERARLEAHFPRIRRRRYTYVPVEREWRTCPECDGRGCWYCAWRGRVWA